MDEITEFHTTSLKMFHRTSVCHILRHNAFMLCPAQLQIYSTSRQFKTFSLASCLQNDGIRGDNGVKLKIACIEWLLHL